MIVFQNARCEIVIRLKKILEMANHECKFPSKKLMFRPFRPLQLIVRKPGPIGPGRGYASPPGLRQNKPEGLTTT